MVLRQVRALLRRRRGGHKTKARAVSAGGVATDDVEVAKLPKKRLQGNALHGMADDESDYEEVLESEEDSDLEDAWESETQKVKVKEEKASVMQRLVNAESFDRFNAILGSYVQKDWYFDDAINGNIYRMSAWGAFRGHRFMKRVRRCEISDVLKEVLVFIGVIIVGIVQIFGAPMYFLSTVFGAGIAPNEKVDLLSWATDTYRNSTAHAATWGEELKQYWAVKSFGVFFLVAFIINATFVILNEKDSWGKLNKIRYFLQHTGNNLLDIHLGWMHLGCFVNCWVVVWCTLDVWLVCAGSTTVKDVLYDGLGLLFLYNLDDIGGDLGFFADEDWKGSELAWMYIEIQDFLGYNKEYTYLKWQDVRDHRNWFADICYNLTISIMIVLLLLLPYLFLRVPVISLTG